MAAHSWPAFSFAPRDNNMTVVDPYPRISPEYVVEELEGLKVRYGAGNVMPEEGQEKSVRNHQLRPPA